MVRVIALRAHSGGCWGVGREGSLAALAEVQVRGYQREGIGAGLRGAAEPGTPCGLGSLGARRPLISVGVGRRGWSRGGSWALAKKEIHSGLQFRRAGTAGTFGNGALNCQLPPEPHTSRLTCSPSSDTRPHFPVEKKRMPDRGKCSGPQDAERQQFMHVSVPRALPRPRHPAPTRGTSVSSRAWSSEDRGQSSRSSQAEFPGWSSRAPPLPALQGRPPAPRGPALKPLQTRPLLLTSCLCFPLGVCSRKYL